MVFRKYTIISRLTEGSTRNFSFWKNHIILNSLYVIEAELRVFFFANHFNYYFFFHSTSFYYLIDIFIGKNFRNPQAIIYKSRAVHNAASPFVASFSSRGPNTLSSTIIKVTLAMITIIGINLCIFFFLAYILEWGF